MYCTKSLQIVHLHKFDFTFDFISSLKIQFLYHFSAKQLPAVNDLCVVPIRRKDYYNLAVQWFNVLTCSRRVGMLMELSVQMQIDTVSGNQCISNFIRSNYTVYYYDETNSNL